VRLFFKILNKLFMVPMFRLGMGPFFGNPFSGYIMVLVTVGRKTGKRRSTPLNYAIVGGDVYCLSGWGGKADWCRNVEANPEVSLIMPGGAMAGRAEDVSAIPERAAIVRQILKNGGFAGFATGLNAWRVSDERLLAKTEKTSLMRVRPTGLANGACDPGGWAWIWTVIATVILIVALVLLIR